MAVADRPRYDFDYEEDDDESGNVSIENKYYNAKQLKATDPQDALAEFLGIPPMEPEKGEWGFKGLKQAIKLAFKLGRYEEVRAGNDRGTMPRLRRAANRRGRGRRRSTTTPTS